MKASYMFFSITIYALAILSLIAISSIYTIYQSIPLVIIMNILAYQIVLRKYKKNPNAKVEDSINDMILLYLSKVGGCFWITYLLCGILMGIRTIVTVENLRGGMIVLFIILFNVTPSVKKGVRSIRERYIYKQTDNTKK